MTDPRSKKPISDLRLRMQADMLNRNFGAKTQHDYLRHVETFAKFIGRAPDTATGDDIRRFQTAEREAGAKPPKMNSQAAALKFFLGVTCGRPDLAQQIARTYYPPKLPSVLAADDVARLLEAAPGPGLKYKAALSVAYGAGLRGGEVTMLRVSDIDSKRMLIRVELGKGRRDRQAMLSPQLLEMLRAWWLQCRSHGWLFPGRDPLQPITVRQLNRACHMAADSGHVARCENAACGFTSIAYNSCRNRHCPKCQGTQARDWMEEREADLLPVPYFHVVFTLPAEIGDIAYQNKAVIYDALFKASSEMMLTIAADPKHLGARIGITAVLHTWGSAMTHDPHVHMIVPGGGMSDDGSKWIASKPSFLLPVLPKGFHRIRHYGLLATNQRADAIERARDLLGVAPLVDAAPAPPASDDTTGADLPPCPCCGARQRIIETFLRGQTPRHRASPSPFVFKVDTS